MRAYLLYELLYAIAASCAGCAEWIYAARDGAAARVLDPPGHDAA